MDFNNLMQSTEFQQLHPVKQNVIRELVKSNAVASPEAMLPQLMTINRELNKRNLSFTKEETQMLIVAMKSGMSPIEQQKVDMLLNLFQV